MENGDTVGVRTSQAISQSSQFTGQSS
ncbi:hypothetical protein RDI58_024599 [Solanum bulbocastanum]|uniref:Uncharacterized protein n=1 Tax=Solanum bulbocastanum TaxID=147425 RepID=A0AAN8Y3T1_SOLBU